MAGLSDEGSVLAAIDRSGSRGRTDDELEVELGLSHQNVSARRRGLVLKNRVHDSGEERRTRSGRSATVWLAGPAPAPMISGALAAVLDPRTGKLQQIRDRAGAYCRKHFLNMTSESMVDLADEFEKVGRGARDMALTDAAKLCTIVAAANREHTKGAIECTNAINDLAKGQP